MCFFTDRTMFRFLLLCIFSAVCIEMHPISSQTYSKKINGKEYIVNLSFSRFSTTKIPDENGQASIMCDDVEFECGSDHRCIPLESYCDGRYDCVDKSDEMMCATTPKIHFSFTNDTIPSSSPTSITTSIQNITLIMFIIWIIC